METKQIHINQDTDKSHVLGSIELSLLTNEIGLFERGVGVDLITEYRVLTKSFQSTVVAMILAVIEKERGDKKAEKRYEEMDAQIPHLLDAIKQHVNMIAQQTKEMVEKEKADAT